MRLGINKYSQLLLNACWARRLLHKTMFLCKQNYVIFCIRYPLYFCGIEIICGSGKNAAAITQRRFMLPCLAAYLAIFATKTSVEVLVIGYHNDGACCSA